MVPRFLSTAGAQAALSAEPLSANPAGAFPTGRWGLSSGSAFYLLTPELNYHTFGAAARLDSFQALSLLGHYWGFDKLTHLHGGLGYALRLLKSSLTLSVRGRWLHTNLQEYGQITQFTPDVGLLWQVSHTLRVGGYGYNLLARGWGRLPGMSSYAIGLSYQPTPQVEVLSDLYQGEAGPLCLHTAVVYRPISLLTVRVGAAVPLIQAGGGFSLTLKRLAVDFGYRYHPVVGSWAGVGLTFPAL